ncbi:hypothetical protein [Paenibacillus sp. BC26]|uniref:hypothetical protein n=1 Tax=Paenibacillus sp. BC26 TaxID=1881032 RepID=UPI0008E92D37|nr:hypothetical protein [Paenibacillus sp. BC26]SFT25667.1 hypothetical protein SAMN05428962_5889 [Paenibacillus sp. BC26]
MEAIKQLEQLTLQLVADIHGATVEQIEDFLELRGSIIEAIQAQFALRPADSTNQEQVNRILSFDSRILGRMEELKHEATQGMDKFNRARVQRDAYGGGGAYGTDNSMFFDERN